LPFSSAASCVSRIRPSHGDRSLPPFVIRREQRNPMSSGEQRADKLRGV
jgi:hypothetical protein